VRSLLRLASEYLNSNQKRLLTIETQFENHFKFIDWCDTNGRYEALSDHNVAREALVSYVTYLKEQIQLNKIRHNRGSELQNDTIKTLKDIFDDQYIDRGINRIRYDPDLVTPTEAPDPESLGMLLALCEAIFEGVHDLTVNRKPFPYSLSIPPFLNWPNNTAIIVPNQEWTHQIDAPFLQRYIGKEYGDHNTDFVCHQRIRRAMIGMRVYHILFISATGMNSAQAADLPWNEDIEKKIRKPIPESQSFRAIKYRAQGKQVSFTIEARQKPRLLKFVNLRKYILQGQSCEKMFFDIDKFGDSG
jgi:hypothetical protein